MDEERNAWVGNDVGRLARGRVGGHDDDGRVGVGRRRQVGVVHEGHVGHVVGACGQVQLFAKKKKKRSRGQLPTSWCGMPLRGGGRTYKSSVFEALHHLRGQSARLALVRVALGRLVVERDLVHGVCRLSIDRAVV